VDYIPGTGPIPVIGLKKSLTPHRFRIDFPVGFKGVGRELVGTSSVCEAILYYFQNGRTEKVHWFSYSEWDIP